ncbi:Alternative oxidase domain-containing protein [Phytophthora infestans]|uniref:Alternative oxidase domain-containing protein n=1 Tax=Phytophthora infestans TaxID=4787 RepID=A0A833S5B9_PHYIN|nr:Alternative oxidase domain-containing protein [Phytophthora infestans]KAF4148001.1 Alternative oxidase domain-containing protein [Phytophthora infestans]
MMARRHVLQSCRPHFGFMPHQLSGVLQARTDKAVFFVKPHGIPIVPSHVVWRVSAIAPAVSTNELSSSPPLRMEIGDVKWTAAPLPEIREMTQEPAALKRLIKSPSRRASVPSTVPTPTKVLKRKISMPNSFNSLDTVETIPQTQKLKKIDDRATLSGIRTHRLGFDLLTGYRGSGGAMTAKDWLNRCLFLETIISAAGMVEGLARHLHSVYSLKQDAKSYMEETRNVSMHQLMFMDMKGPGWLARTTVLAVQSVTFSAFSLTYMFSPKTCHRFMELVEEEAVKTYTFLLEDMEHGHLDDCRNYYDLPDDAKVYDMIKCIYADEASHHVFVKNKNAHSTSRINYRTIMCIKVECPTCHKATWKGCGQHIDAALVGVKEEERCPNWKTGKHEST